VRLAHSSAPRMPRRPLWLALAATTLLAPVLLLLIVPRLTAAHPSSSWPGVWKSLADRQDDGNLILLNSGKVFEQFLYNAGSARIYDPAADTWVYTKPLGKSLYVYGFTSLMNGKQLVVGYSLVGYTSVISATAIYDPQSDTWASGQPIPDARDSFSTSLLADGRVLVIGGKDPMTGDGRLATDIYDPATDMWSVTGSLPEPLGSPRTLLLQDGRVMAFAGVSPNSNCKFWCATSSVELYDPRTGSWSLGTNLPITLWGGATTTLLPSGRVLLAGGSDDNGKTRAGVDIYDPTNNTWSSVAPMLTAREGHTATLLATGQVLVAGGEQDGNAYVMSAEIYTPSADTWQATTDMPRAHYNASAVRLANGQVLVSGDGPLPGSTGSLLPPQSSYAFADSVLPFGVPRSGGDLPWQDLFSTVPGLPTNVQASVSNGSATVMWTAPLDDGSAITGFTITAAPGGPTKSVGANAMSATLTGFNPGTSYTFTVSATNALGASLPSAMSNAVVPAAAPTPTPPPPAATPTPTPEPTATLTPEPTATTTPSAALASTSNSQTPPSNSGIPGLVYVLMGTLVALLAAGGGLAAFIRLRGAGTIQPNVTEAEPPPA
jgi:Fibronectin type III domain/Kelch motif